MPRGGMLTGPGGQTPAPTPASSTSSDRTYTYVRELRDLSGGETRNVWYSFRLLYKSVRPSCPDTVFCSAASQTFLVSPPERSRNSLT